MALARCTPEESTTRPWCTVRTSFSQIVSCNTHNISVLVKALGMDSDGTNHLEDGRFLCMRRANDISQDTAYIASPTVGRSCDDRFGTHHARDSHDLFATMGYDLNLFRQR